MKILIVDDEDGNRKLFRQMVGKFNLFESVRVACDIEQARNILNDQNDLGEWLVLSDIRLSPGLGPELKKDFPHIPFIFMTGFCDEEEGKIAKKMAWNGQILGKPFTIKDLKQALAELVSHMKNGK